MDIFREDAYRGRTVFVAGGSSGINLGIARRFGEMGANVALISRSEERIASAAAQVRETGAACIGMAADVRDYESVTRALVATADKWGPIDVVIWRCGQCPVARDRPVVQRLSHGGGHRPARHVQCAARVL